MREEEYADDLSDEEEIRRGREADDRREYPRCDYCGSEEFTLLGELGRIMHLRCRACGMDTKR